MPFDFCRIVAIDCDAALGARLLTEFRSREYDFHWFADGREALGKLQEIQPDVIVCEMILPGLDGLALLETVRLWPGLRDVPFLVLSTVRSDAIIHAALEAGASAYLVKPCSVWQLKQTIHMVLENAPPRRHRDEPRDDAVSVLALADPPWEPSEPVGATHPAAEAGAGPAGEAQTGTPPAAKPVKARRVPVARRRSRKPKLPATEVQPVAEPEPIAGPGDLALADMRPWPQHFEPGADIVTSPSFWTRSRTVPWSHIAAALLAIGVASDSQPRESLPSGVTDRMTTPERSEAPTGQAVPATPVPQATEPSPSPEPSVEPTPAPPQAGRSVGPMVRGRLQWAQALYDEGRYDDARAALSEVMKLAPSNAQALLLAARLERFAASLPGSAQTASEEDRRAVLALLWRYQAAVEQMDIAGLRAIWPNLDAQAMRERWNRGGPSRQRALRLIDLEVTGDEAVAMCVSYDHLATHGEERANRAQVSFHLRRANLSWVIDDVK
ncbi:MAG TPA: response regulator [Vicinamibacteria bacterium]|nr:response regulator [Vicinamibacteria bacterium]